MCFIILLQMAEFPQTVFCHIPKCNIRRRYAFYFFLHILLYLNPNIIYKKNIIYKVLMNCGNTVTNKKKGRFAPALKKS